MIKVPYHRQEFWFSCLPACIKMLSEFHNFKMEEKALRKLFKTTIRGGTSWSYIVIGLREIGLDFVYLKDQTLSKLKNLIENGIPVIVSIDSRKLGDIEHRNHTIIVIDINENYVIVHDTEKGPDVKLDVKTFVDAWERRNYRMGYVGGSFQITP
ncbi:MAG: C39 family peptidase [Candidatus Aenigmarchaeota archaeon]|nr:C39 family peptidase [Candidatus Aenigmarchaeota archaeon]